jgi:hypothetical protein
VVATHGGRPTARDVQNFVSARVRDKPLTRRYEGYYKAKENQMQLTDIPYGRYSHPVWYGVTSLASIAQKRQIKRVARELARTSPAFLARFREELREAQKQLDRLSELLEGDAP